MTFNEALEAFTMEQRLRGNTEKTIRGYQGFISQFITYLERCSITKVTALTLQHVQKYQLYISSRRCTNKSQQLTRRTVRTYMRNIRIFIAFLYDEGFVVEPIHQRLKLPKAEKPTIEILTDEETDRLQRVFGDELLCKRNRAMVYLMLDSGLRLSEVAGLRVSNINFDDGYIMVTGKGRKGRIVPIGRKASEALKMYIKVRPAGGGSNLFLSIRGTPITPGGVLQMIKRLKHESSIPRLHAHLLRHTFATNFILHGFGDVYQLSRILGHSEIRITEGYVQLASYYAILQNRNRQTYLDKKSSGN